MMNSTAKSWLHRFSRSWLNGGRHRRAATFTWPACTAAHLAAYHAAVGIPATASAPPAPHGQPTASTAPADPGDPRGVGAGAPDPGGAPTDGGGGAPS